MNEKNGFAVWLTGIPASGKSSITANLSEKLRARRVPVIVLESDEMRRILAPEPDYTDPGRERFYRQLVLLGQLITRGGVSVIFDATANKRAYRDYARTLIPKFLEIYVECPLEVCKRRDPKGIYAAAEAKKATNVPGIQAPYEPPAAPELTVDGQSPPGRSADIILDKLKQFLYI